VGVVPTVGLEQASGVVESAKSGGLAVPMKPTVGQSDSLVPESASAEARLVTVPSYSAAALGTEPTVDPIVPGSLVPVAQPGDAAGLSDRPTVGSAPTVGLDNRRREIKPIRDVQDALTLAGQVLYKTMYGAPDGAKSKSCTKGYRQLAAETHLDKDTVRDLITEFKDKGIVREIRSYNPDTRLAKTYEILSYKAILQIWRDVGLSFVTTGRKRPVFCTAEGELLSLGPTVGTEPTVGPKAGGAGRFEAAQGERYPAAEVIQVLQQITGTPVDQEAADRLIKNCRFEAPDCSIEEIVEFAWSKAFLCRSGKIDNPIGFLITQVPKHFQGEAFQTYRTNKRKELEVAAAAAAREEQRRQEAEAEIAEMQQQRQLRSQIAERHRIEQGIDLKSLLKDAGADDALKDWAKRMLKLGFRYQASYE